MSSIHPKVAIVLSLLGIISATIQADDPPPSQKAEDPALVEFRKVYRLEPGQLIKRIPPPFAPWRLADAEARSPYLKQNPQLRDAISTMIYEQRQGKVQDRSTTFGNGQDDGRWLVYLLESVAGYPPQEVEGPEDLMKRPIKGDWVVSADVPREKLLPAFEAILREQCKLPVRLKIKELERDVVVARGRYEFKPLPKSEDTIELYGATLTPGVGGGGTDSFREFLIWTGRFVEPNRLIIDEVETRPKGQISWHLNFRGVMTDKTILEDHGDELVFKHLTEQTGLTFTFERRKIPILVVEYVE